MTNKSLENIKLKFDSPYTTKIVKNCYIADISGFDSIAALIDVLEKDNEATILPSIVDISCEYGDKAFEYKKSIHQLMKEFNTSSTRILPCVVCSVDDLWRESVSRDIQELINDYGFYSPCISCHLVFHLIRIKLAKYFNISRVISGERELHSQKEKINQLDFVLDFFNDIYAENTILHLQPLRKISDSRKIQEKVGMFDVHPVSLKCLFSGNYYKSGTNDLSVDKKNIKNYIEGHLRFLMEDFKNEYYLKCSVIE